MFLIVDDIIVYIEVQQGNMIQKKVKKQLYFYIVEMNIQTTQLKIYHLQSLKEKIFAYKANKTFAGFVC